MLTEYWSIIYQNWNGSIETGMVRYRSRKHAHETAMWKRIYGYKVNWVVHVKLKQPICYPRDTAKIDDLGPSSDPRIDDGRVLDAR